MPTFTSFLNAASITDSVVNNAGGPVGNTNAALQASAAASGLLPVNPATAVAVITTNSVAFGSAITQFQSDLATHNTQQEIGDGLTVLGDFIGTAGGTAAVFAPQFGTPLTYLGNAVTATGIIADNSTALANGITNVQTALVELNSEAQQALNGDSSALQATFNNIGPTAVSDFNATETGITNALNALSTAIQNFGTSSFNTNISTFSTDISNLETPLTNLYNDTGETAPSINETVNSNNTFNITNTSNSAIASGNISTDGNGNITSVTGTDTIGNSLSQGSTINSDGSITNTEQSTNSSDTVLYTQSTDFTVSGATTVTISGTGDNDVVGGANITIDAGTSANINGSSDTINSTGSDTIGGNLNDDSIISGSSQVTLSSGSTNDTITGDSDTIAGGTGSDIIISSNYLDNSISMGSGSTVTQNLPLYNQSVVTQYDPNSSFNLVTLNYAGVGGNNGSNVLDQASYVYANTDGTDANTVTYKYNTADNIAAGMNADYNEVINTDNSSGHLINQQLNFNTDISGVDTTSILYTFDPTSGSISQALTNWIPGVNGGGSTVQINEANGNTIINDYTSHDGSGVITQSTTNWAGGGALVDTNPGMVNPDQAEVLNTYSNADQDAASLTQQQIDNTNGSEQLEIINPTNPTQYETLNQYATAGNSGSLTSQTIFDTANSTYQVEQLDAGGTQNNVFSSYDGTPTDQAINPYQVTTDWGPGNIDSLVGSQVDTYAGFASTSFASGAPAYTTEEIDNFSGIEDAGKVNTIFNIDPNNIVNGIGSEEDFFTSLPTAIDDIANGVVASVTETIKDFANAGGFQYGEVPDDKIFDLSDGQSQQYFMTNLGQQGQATSSTDLFSGATQTINQIINDYNSTVTGASGLDPSNAENSVMNFANGDSKETFSAAILGTDNLQAQNLATSVTDAATGQADSAIHDIIKGYDGLDGTASGLIPTDKIFDLQDGDSQQYFMNNLAGQGIATSATDIAGQLENIDEVIKSFDTIGGAPGNSGNMVNQISNFTNGTSEETLTKDFSTTTANDIINGLANDTVNSIVKDYAAADGALSNETPVDKVLNLQDGHSMETIINGLPSNVLSEVNGFSADNAAGELMVENLEVSKSGTTDGISIINSFNGSDALTGSQDRFYNSSGTELGYQNYNASSQYVSGSLGDGSGDYDDDYTDSDYSGSDPSSGSPTDGFDGDITGGNGDTSTNKGTSTTLSADVSEFEFVKALGTGNNNIGPSEIIQHDLQVCDKAAAAAAEASFQQASQQATGNGSSIAVFSGSKWGSNVITWSMADSAGTAASPFSGYMGAKYQPLIQEAFATWAAASGLTFKQVSDSSASDIRIGWGDFDTSNTGIAGFTASEVQGGQLAANTIIRLEDPSQNPLIAGANGGTYSGTEASVYQVLLHEIGHALGLGDDADPNSIMYYEATGQNTGLDSTDIAGIKALYSSPSIQAAHQLIQAMATLSDLNSGMSSTSTGNSVTASAFANAISIPQHAHAA